MTLPTDPPSNAARMASPSYRLAALDQDFMLGGSMRGVRFLLEFAKADEALKAWGVRSTIVVFGSARVQEAGAGAHGRWYDAARAFGRIVSERGGAIRGGQGPRDNVIATGGGPGIMAAANRGAADAGAPHGRLRRLQCRARFTSPLTSMISATRPSPRMVAPETLGTRL
jgi:hypothetical protein